jgi:hypothetical protein
MPHRADVFRGRLSGSEGFRWLEEMVHAFVRGDETRRGPLPGGDRDDVAQEVNYKLLCEWGDDYPRRIESLWQREDDSGEPSGGSRDEPDRQFVLDVINRAIARTHWTVNKRRQRGLPEFVPITADVEGIPSPDPSELIDLAIDIRHCLESLSPIEQRIWRGRVEGKTVHELGVELGLNFRRVSEIAREVIGHIASTMQAGPAGREFSQSQSARRG